MEDDKTLQEFVQILGRINDLVGEVATADDKGTDLVDAIAQLRLSGKDKDADVLAKLCARAEELKAQNQAKTS